MSDHGHHRIQGKESHPELADFVVRSLHLPLEPFLKALHVMLCSVMCQLEHLQVALRLL